MEGLSIQIYLTDKEISALIDASSEWCEIIGSGNEDSCKCVDERLENGLGSALYKLYKGKNGQRLYAEYAKKRK